jgi:hypothetical protein
VPLIVSNLGLARVNMRSELESRVSCSSKPAKAKTQILTLFTLILECYWSSWWIDKWEPTASDQVIVLMRRLLR